LEQMGVKTIHLCDLSRARDNSLTNLDLIKAIVQSTNYDIQVVGGIKNSNTIKQYLNLGAKRVVLSAGSVLSLGNIDLKEILNKYKAQITISVDGVGNKLAKNAWQDITDIDLIETAKKIENVGFEEIIYTDVSRDGTLTEPNYEMIKKMIDIIRIPLIVAGGISAVSQLTRLKKMGAGGALFGKALFYKSFNLKEALELC